MERLVLIRSQRKNESVLHHKFRRGTGRRGKKRESRQNQQKRVKRKAFRAGHDFVWPIIDLLRRKPSIQISALFEPINKLAFAPASLAPARCGLYRRPRSSQFGGKEGAVRHGANGTG